MKLDNKNLEIYCLASITKSFKCMESLLSKNITDEHFEFQADGDIISYSKQLFTFIMDYWKVSNSLFTDLVLESTLDSKKIPSGHRKKFFSLWSLIEECDVDENNFYEITSQLKNRQALKIFSSSLQESASKLKTNTIKEAINVIENSLASINNELLDYVNEKQSFDVTESSTFFENEYNKRLNSPELFKGINCGISNIDNKTFGWMPGQIVVFLAPSSGGKSVMMLNSALHANKVCGKKVLYMSFEMNAWLCMLRHIALSFEIPYDQIKGTNLSKDELKTIIEGLKKQEQGPYFEYDVNMEDPTPDYIDSKIRELIATKGKPDLLVVDYIGNMTVRNAPNGSKDWENQSKAVQGLFLLAKRYNIPVITAQQINRETIRDSRKSKDANKFMSYDQAAASGGQNLMHLCTYAIAMEPNRDLGYCVLHPVKMRDAWFHPFPVRLNSIFNKVEEIDEEEQQQIMGLHGVATGNKIVKETSDKTPIKDKTNAFNSEEMFDNKEIDEEEIVKIDMSNDEELDVSDWMLS
jgi:replicative DNA helicase